MAKSKKRMTAREMRSTGESIKTIAKKLKVSTSTASLWCRDIQLSQTQIKELERRGHDPFYGRRLEYAQKQRKIKETKIANLLEKGIVDIGALNKRELFISGVCLYWSEGFKKDNLAGFSNSDPYMVKFFIHWLEKCCEIPQQRLKFRLGVNEQYRDNVKAIEDYWSHFLNTPLSQFQKPFFQKVKWQKEYDHPENYHGVLRVRVSKSTDFLRLMLGWIEGLKKNTP